jgi:hypothetical protein
MHTSTIVVGKTPLFAVALAAATAGIAVGAWRQAFVSQPSTLTLHLRGWGTVLRPYVGRHGPCPDGKDETPIVSPAGRSIGSVVECDLLDSKTDEPNWGVRSTHVEMVATYTIPGGTLVTAEQRTFLFSRQALDSTKPIRTVGRFAGRLTGGSGRYVHARGTVTGGGPGINGEADWTVTFHFR